MTKTKKELQQYFGKIDYGIFGVLRLAEMASAGSPTVPKQEVAITKASLEDLADSLKEFSILVNKMSDAINLTSDKSDKRLHLNFYESKFGKSKIMINCDLYYQMFNSSQLRAYEPGCHYNFYFMQEQDL